MLKGIKLPKKKKKSSFIANSHSPEQSLKLFSLIMLFVVIYLNVVLLPLLDLSRMGIEQGTNNLFKIFSYYGTFRMFGKFYYYG